MTPEVNETLPSQIVSKPLTGNVFRAIYSVIVISHLRKFAFEMYFNPFQLPPIHSLVDDDGSILSLNFLLCTRLETVLPILC